MRRVAPLVLALMLGACAQDDPTIGQQPQPTDQPTTQTRSDWFITAVEYEFQRAPVLLSEGEYTFTLENAGREKHELYLFYISGPQSVAELLELPEKKVNKLTQAVDRAVAPPLRSDSFTAALVPGRFGYVCFVVSPEGKPHALLGMRGELMVT